VRPLLRDALPTVIEQPARLAGLAIDGDLITRLVADTDGGEALPLLAYTLSQLADGMGRGGTLRMSRYEELGGVHGTLTRQANAALEDAMAASGRSGEQVIRGLLGLVTVDEQGRPTRRRVPYAELAPEVSAELPPFVERRLLTTDTADGHSVVEVAHEAFLSAWAPLAQAVKDNSAALRARRGIEQAAEDWCEAKRASARLWERGQLAAALADTGARINGDGDRGGTSAGWKRHMPRRHRELVTQRVALSRRAQEFMQASIRWDRRRRARSTTVLALLLVLSVTAAVIAVVQLQAAEQGQRLATARLLMDRAEAILGVDPRTALRLGEAAADLHPDPETRSDLSQLMLDTHYAGTLTGHNDQLYSMAFSPDGRTLATASADKTVILWDVTDPSHPQPRGTPLTGHTREVYSVAFAPDGRTLATASADKTVILWDVTDPSHPQRPGTPLTHTEEVYSVAFAPDGRTLATAGPSDNLILWDLTDPTRPQAIGQPLPGSQRVAFAPEVLATGSYEGVILWDLTDPAQPQPIGKPLTDSFEGQRSVAQPVVPLAFAQNGQVLAARNADNAVILWDLRDPAQPQTIGQPLPSSAFSGAFAPDGHTLATSNADGTASLWNLTEIPPSIGQPLTGRVEANGSVSYSTVTSLAFSPDGQTLATGGNGILWDISDPNRPQALDQPRLDDDNVLSVAFAPDGRTLATASVYKEVMLWDLTDPARPQPIGGSLPNSDWVFSVAFAPDGRTLAIAGGYGVILWDVTDPARPQPIGAPLTLHTNVVHSVAFAPDGRTLATAGADQTVILWDVTDPARPQTVGAPLTGHTDIVNQVTFAPDGHILASASDDGTVILWDLTDPAQPQTLGGPLADHSGSVQGVAFAPDGHTLATKGDSEMILWDLTDPARPQTLGAPLPDGDSGAVAFAPDGHTLAVSGDGIVLRGMRSLEALRDRPLERACRITNGGLSADEWAHFAPGLPYRDSCHHTHARPDPLAPSGS
jgi:WD40 repeat protein